ncbi:MAG: NfeD family protein [Bacteroidales bacterium]|jgi:membrane-bound serine protease (ClpP class)|nr:NfeD family protein [Bacteroidales bacterium]
MYRLLLASFLMLLPLFSSGQEKSIFVIPVKGEISKATERILSRGLKEAKDNNYDLVIIHMNTYGGAVSSADSMRSSLLRFPVPVAAFIDNQAVSAGALISIACDSIYMITGSTIGAATVVNQTGEPMPDKYQSFMRAMMRSTAQANGRDPLIAEAMVDPSIVVPGIADDSLKVLSFTMEEAILNNYCEGSASSLAEVASLFANGTNFTIKEMKISGLDKIISFLLSPVLQGILLMLIIGGLYFELQSPGIGFPSAAAVIAALLYFAPLYLEGLAENWEILLFVAGILLILAEIFVIPGFGVAGISGIVVTVTALVFAMIDNDLFYFNGSVNFIVILKPLSIVLISGFSSLLLSIWLAGRVLPGSNFSHLSLKTSLKSKNGFVGVDDNQESMVGKIATVASSLRPAGKVDIDGKWYDATLEFGMADKGEVVVITKSEGGRLYCERLPQ